MKSRRMREEEESMIVSYSVSRVSYLPVISAASL